MLETILKLLLYIPPVLFSIVLHEFMHAYVADKLGDPLPRRMGRVTLNPIAHIDPVGTIIVPIVLMVATGVAFGWAKPVMTNPMNTLNPKRTFGLTALAGPVTNLALAFLFAVLLRFVKTSGSVSMEALGIDQPLAIIAAGGMLINIVLFVFNFIPIPPLDGGRVLAWVLPDEYSHKLAQIEPYGMFIIFGLMMLNPGHFLDKLYIAVFHLIKFIVF